MTDIATDRDNLIQQTIIREPESEKVEEHGGTKKDLLSPLMFKLIFKMSAS